MTFSRVAEKTKITNIFNDLVENYNFGAFIRGDLSFYTWCCENYISQYCIEHGLHFYDGATRVVVVSENSEFVYKFNKWRNDDVDYCEQEYQVYQEAQKAGGMTAKAFLPIDYLMRYEAKNDDENANYLDIYIAPYCDMDEDDMSDRSADHAFRQYCIEMGLDPDNLTDEQREEISDDYYDDASDTEGMLAFAQSEWVDDLWEDTIKFIRGLGLNDLHSGNWGFYKGQLVIADYAGYGIDLFNSEEDYE